MLNIPVRDRLGTAANGARKVAGRAALVAEEASDEAIREAITREAICGMKRRKEEEEDGLMEWRGN